jgi:hypothetical protein
MQSNGQIILKMVLFVALPIAALSFLLGSVVPKQMGIEKETRATILIVSNGFFGILAPLLSALYAVKLARKKTVDE